MSSTKEQVLTFLEKCEELKNCKFIMATTKIKDILKCIVNSPELYGLFEAVTNGYDYVESKRNCLVTVNEGVFERSFVILPKSVGHRLAFIFCLFVEFDGNNINFNDFLSRYFPEDGSYFASYRAFCNMIVKGLQDAVIQVFGEELKAPDVTARTDGENAVKAELISALEISIQAEKKFVAESALPSEDKEGAEKILNALNGAIKVGDVNLIEALVCGYNYFVLFNKCASEGIGALIQSILAYEQVL